jgi:hypothetical protein
MPAISLPALSRRAPSLLARRQTHWRRHYPSLPLAVAFLPRAAHKLIKAAPQLGNRFVLLGHGENLLEFMVQAICGEEQLLKALRRQEVSRRVSRREGRGKIQM